MAITNLKKLLVCKKSLQIESEKSKFLVACSIVCFLPSFISLINPGNLISLCALFLISLACAFVMCKEINRIREYREDIQEIDEQITLEIKNIVEEDMNRQENLDN